MLLGLLPAWMGGPSMLLGVIVATYLLARFALRPLYRALLKRHHEALAGPMSRFLYYLTLVVGVGIGLQVAGYGQAFGVLGTIAAAGTLAIGFAMKDTIAAFVSGIFIFVDRPFQIDDWIEWDGSEGKVVDITLRTTKVETFDNELLTVPNDRITNTTVKNRTAKDKLRVKLTFGIGYDDDIDEAAEHIRAILNDVKGIAKEPAPTVRLHELGDATVDLRALYWIKNPKKASTAGIKAEVLQRVKDTFEDHDIDMPYPTQSIRDSEIVVRDA